MLGSNVFDFALQELCPVWEEREGFKETSNGDGLPDSRNLSSRDNSFDNFPLLPTAGLGTADPISERGTFFENPTASRYEAMEFSQTLPGLPMNPRHKDFFFEQLA